ncbi:MAG: hypothetical protein M1835_003521, partial [Candelina submexicana]
MWRLLTAWHLLILFATRIHQVAGVDIVLKQPHGGDRDSQTCRNVPSGACCRFVPTGSAFDRSTYYSAEFTGLENLDIASVWSYTSHLMSWIPGNPPPIRNCFGTVLETHPGSAGSDWLFQDVDAPLVLPAMLGQPRIPRGIDKPLSPRADPDSPDGRPGIQPGGNNRPSRSDPPYAFGPPPMVAGGPRTTRITGASYIRLDAEKARLAAAENIKAFVWGGSGLLDAASSLIGSSGSNFRRRLGKKMKKRQQQQQQQDAEPQVKLHAPTEWVYPDVLVQDGVTYTREGDAHALKYKSGDGVVLDFSVD